MTVKYASRQFCRTYSGKIGVTLKRAGNLLKLRRICDKDREKICKFSLSFLNRLVFEEKKNTNQNGATENVCSQTR